MGRKQAARPIKSGYVGWLSDGDVSKMPTTLETISPAIEPELFWRDYISQRKPVLIDGHPQDPSWKATERWSAAYLQKTAGTAPVMVENRGNGAESFGQGKKIAMPFSDVLRQVFSGDDTLYMTTQEAPLGPDGHPEVLAPPTAHLARDFPLQPSLLGNLVPQQINIWMGCAPEGAHTGLHHDFHDNLYVLLRGKKRFRLYPPSMAGSMYVHGTLTKIHPNGRIVYKDAGDILADGSDAKEVAAWTAKRDAERELVAAEADVAAGVDGAKERLALAEQTLDSVLDSVLDAAFDDVDFDDFEAMEERSARDGNPGNSLSLKKKGQNDDKEPDSFSRVDLSLPPSKLRAQFPLFPGVDAAIECEVSAGQSLFLPAGYFHEVTSYSGSPDAPGSDAAHLALNYWVHPPDNVSDPSPAGFRMPYTTEYWSEIWKARKERYMAGIRGGGEKSGEKSVSRKRKGAAISEKAHHKHKHEHKHTHTHHHGCGCGGNKGEEKDTGEMDAGERAHFLRCTRGMFGYGRRQHLHRFVTARFRT